MIQASEIRRLVENERICASLNSNPRESIVVSFRHAIEIADALDELERLKAYKYADDFALTSDDLHRIINECGSANDLSDVTKDLLLAHYILDEEPTYKIRQDQAQRIADLESQLASLKSAIQVHVAVEEDAQAQLAALRAEVAEKGSLDPLIIADIQNPITVKRFQKFVRVDESGCHIWTGTLHSKGYGVFHLSKEFGGGPVRAHRVAWALAGKPLLPDMELDHVCRNRPCVHAHPDHLDQVTDAVNVLRGEGPTAINKRKTTCPEGHPYDEGNTYISRGKRYCRACQAIHRAAWNSSFNARRTEERNARQAQRIQ